MSKRAITVDFYQSLVTAYRTAPGNYRHAADSVHCDPRLARKAWETGINYAREETGARRPIKDVIAEEQMVARARMEEEAARVRALTEEQELKRQAELKEKARRDSTDSRVQEGQLVRLARGGSSNLLASLTNIAAGATKIGQQVRAGLEKIALDPTTGEARDLKPTELAALTRLIGNLATNLRQASDAARSAMEMERLLLGEPTSIVGTVNMDNLTMDEAEKRIEAAQRALARAKANDLKLDATDGTDSLPLVH